MIPRINSMESRLECECKDLKERLRELINIDASNIVLKAQVESLQVYQEQMLKENKRLADCILDKDRVIDELIKESSI